MICLTGDVHHMSLCTGNQLASDLTETKTAQMQADLCREAGVKLTLFVSGKCFTEEWHDVEPFVDNPVVELGGHNWSCFQPQILHRLFNKVLKSYNGPAWYQLRDAVKTIEIIRNKTGRTIEAWRNHMYMHGPHTERVLKQAGIKVVSDGVKRDTAGPEMHPEGIYTFPINVIPDHEHLLHAERTPKWVKWWQDRYNWSDDFGPASYHIHEWKEIVLDCLRKNEEAGRISNLIIHPITMYLCDGFHAFKQILDYIADKETVWMSETLIAKREMVAV